MPMIPMTPIALSVLSSVGACFASQTWSMCARRRPRVWRFPASVRRAGSDSLWRTVLATGIALVIETLSSVSTEPRHLFRRRSPRQLVSPVFGFAFDDLLRSQHGLPREGWISSASPRSRACCMGSRSASGVDGLNLDCLPAGFRAPTTLLQHSRRLWCATCVTRWPRSTTIRREVGSRGEDSDDPRPHQHGTPRRNWLEFRSACSCQARMMLGATLFSLLVAYTPNF